MYPDLDALSFQHIYFDCRNRQDYVCADEVDCRSGFDQLSQ